MKKNKIVCNTNKGKNVNKQGYLQFARNADLLTNLAPHRRQTQPRHAISNMAVISETRTGLVRGRSGKVKIEGSRVVDERNCGPGGGNAA